MLHGENEEAGSSAIRLTVIVVFTTLVFATAFHDGWHWMSEWYTLGDPSLDTSPWWVNVCRGVVLSAISGLVLAGLIVGTLWLFSLQEEIHPRNKRRLKKKP